MIVRIYFLQQYLRGLFDKGKEKLKLSKENSGFSPALSGRFVRDGEAVPI